MTQSVSTRPLLPARATADGTHRRLLEEALLLFGARGFHGVSVREITEATGIRASSLYAHMESKEQLLFECFVAGIEQIRAGFHEAKNLDVPARERLNVVLRNYAKAMASEFGWCMVRVEDQDLSPDMSSHIKAMKSEIDQGIRRLIREGVQDGSIHPCDPKMTAFALAGSLNWIAHWYRENQSMTSAQIADAFITVFDNGLQPRRATRT